MSRLVSASLLVGLLLIGLVLPLVGTADAEGVMADSPQGTYNSPRHDLPIAVSLLLLEGGEGYGAASLSVHITRLAYADEASIRLLVTPDGAGELVAGEENGTLPAGENADLKWTITVLQGARISCQVLSSQGSLLGGDSLDVAGGPTPVPTLDGAGLLQADRTATRAPSAPTAMISISYALCFRGETGSATYPCRNAYYELWKLAGGIESKVRSGYADGNGLISLTNVASGNLSLRFYANDGSTCKVDAGGVIGTVYGWTSGYGEILVNEDFTLTVDDSNRGVWAAYSTVQDGYNWLKTETGWSRSQVRVQWPVGDWPQSNGNNIFLTNVGSYANSIWGREVVLHEYAHCIQYALPGGWPPWSWGGSHYIYTESDRGFALLEGWAEFFPCAVDDSAEFMGYDLESDQFADVLSNGDWDGEIVEGAVAAIMWDIFDGVSLEDHASYELSGYGDRVDGEFAEFWRIFSTLEPLGMDDVWGEWTTKNVDLWAIFYSSRVNKDVGYPTNPTGADEAPSSDSWSDGMEVTITLTGASDDLSGIWGFHYRWASSASDPTGADFYAGTSITSVLEHDQWVLSVRAVDRSGRVASGWTFFAYYSDAVAPSNPSLVTSDHLISRWSQERTIGMQWSGASDALSGVKGYSVVMDRAPTTLPDSTLDTSSGSGSFIVSDGLWYFHLRTVDNANNWAATAVHMGPFWIDNGDPDLSASLTGALGLGGFYVGPVAVTISAHDAGSGVDEVEYREGSDPWTEYAGSMIVTGDGAHHIEVRVTDLAGNGDSLEFELHIDTTRPTAPSSYDSTIAVGEWNNGAATNISWSGMEDEGGILGFSYLLSEDPIALPDELVDATFSSLDEMALPEGAWYLNVRSADRAGHFSAQALSIGPFLIDRAAPSTSLLAMEPVPESGWYTGPVAFALSASDALSGVQVIEMRVDGGEWMTMTGNFTFSQEGGHTLEHRSRDLAGNFAPIVSYDLAIDMTPPAPPLAFLSSLALGHYLSSNQTMLSWSGAADEASGVAGYLLTVGHDPGGDPPLGEIQVMNSTDLFLQEGVWSVFVWSVDRSGWISAAPLMIGPFMVDTIAPSAVQLTVEGTLGMDGWYRSEVSISMDAEDERSGVSHYEMSMDGMEWVQQSSPLLLSAEGRHERWVRAVDGAGNRGPVSGAQVGVDLTAPVTVAVTDISPAGGWFDSPVTVHLESGDAWSGVVLRSRLNEDDWQQGTDTFLLGDGIHTLAFYAVDGAGNEEEPSLLTFSVDASAPRLDELTGDPLDCLDSDPRPLRLTANAFDAWSGLGHLSFAFRFGDGEWSEDLTAEPGEGGSYSILIPAETWMANVGTQLTWTVKASDILGHSDEASATLVIADDDVLPPEGPEITLGPDYSLLLHSNDQSGWAITVGYFFSTSPDNVFEVAPIPDAEGHALFALGADTLIAHLGEEIFFRYQVRDLDADRPGDSSCGPLSAWSSLGTIEDTTPPVSLVAVDGTTTGVWFTTMPVLNITASDAMSGLRGIWIKVDDAEWALYSLPPQLEDGVHCILISAEDVAGNREEPQQLDLEIDVTSPLVEGSIMGASAIGGWRNSSAIFTMSATDPSSGVSSVEFCLDGSPWRPYSTPVPLVDGHHDIQCRAEDNAGNVRYASPLQVAIDSIAPLLNLSALFAGNTAVDVVASDELSGISALTLSIDGGPPSILPSNSSWHGSFDLSSGDHVITLTARDAAGNQATRSVQVNVPASPVSPWPVIIMLGAVGLIAVGALILVRRRR